MKKLLLGAVMAALFMSDASALTKTARATIDQEQIMAIGANHESKISPAMQQLSGLEAIITSHWLKEDSLKVKEITSQLNTLKKNVRILIAFLEPFLTDKKKASVITASVNKTVTAINAIQTAAIALKTNPNTSTICSKQIIDALTVAKNSLTGFNGTNPASPIATAMTNVTTALTNAINAINQSVAAAATTVSTPSVSTGGRGRR